MMLLKNAVESFETYSLVAPSILSCLQTKNDIVTNQTLAITLLMRWSFNTSILGS